MKEPAWVDACETCSTMRIMWRTTQNDRDRIAFLPTIVSHLQHHEPSAAALSEMPEVTPEQWKQHVPFRQRVIGANLSVMIARVSFLFMLTIGCAAALLQAYGKLPPPVDMGAITVYILTLILLGMLAGSITFTRRH